MLRDWSRAGADEVNNVAIARDFKGYGKDDFTALIARCQSWYPRKDWVADRAKVNCEVFEKELERLRNEELKQARDAAEAERKQRLQAVEDQRHKERTAQLATIGGDVKETKQNTAEGVAVSKRSYSELKRSTRITIVGIVIGVASTLLVERGCLKQKEPDARHAAPAATDAGPAATAITNSTPSMPAQSQP